MKLFGIPLNANAVHNYVNGITLLTGSIIALNLDWTWFGFDPITALKIAGYIMVANAAGKFGMNYFRDGLGGMVATQPPVEPPAIAARPDPIENFDASDVDGLR